MADDLDLGRAKFWDTDKDENGEPSNAGAFIGKFYSPSREKVTNVNFLPAIKSHFITVAPAREGKGVSQIIPNLLNYGGSCVVVDPKGENAWVTWRYRAENLGQKVFILDPWGEVKRRYGDKMRAIDPQYPQPHTTTFNPLSILDPNGEDYSEDLAYLSDALIINEGKDPHWDNSARELVAGLIAYLVEMYPGQATLEALRALLSKPIAEINGIAEDAQKLGPRSLAARKLGRFCADNKEISGIISTAITQTAFLDSSALCNSLNEGQGIFEALRDGATIYLVLPADKLQTFGRWLRLMVSIGIRTVSRFHDRLDAPVMFILDEFGTIGKLSAVSKAYGLMAGLNMCMWAFVQDLNQLKRDYPEEWETFLANTQEATFFGATDQFTSEYVSKLLGTTTLKHGSLTSSLSTGGEKSSHTSSFSVQHFARALALPEEVRKCEHGIVIGKGHSPVLIGRMVYYEDPFFMARAVPNVFFPEAEQAIKESKLKAAREAQAAARQAKQEAAEIKLRREHPDFEAAKAFLESHGCTVKIGWFGGVKISKGADVFKFWSKNAAYEQFIEDHAKDAANAPDNPAPASVVLGPAIGEAKAAPMIQPEAEAPPVRSTIGLNSSCPCGSGEMYKYCCMPNALSKTNKGKGGRIPLSAFHEKQRD